MCLPITFFAGVVNNWRECKAALRTVEDKTGIIDQYTHGGADGCFTVPIEELQSRRGITEDYSKWFGEKVDTLNIVETFNLLYNAGVLVREGIGYLITFDKLVNTSPDSELCFRPLVPMPDLYFVWKKYQVFTPIAAASCTGRGMKRASG